MTQVSEALTTLHRAIAVRDFVFGLFNAMEKKELASADPKAEGDRTPKATAYHENHVSPLEDKVSSAEAAVAKAKPVNEREVLLKVSALIDEGMTAENIVAVRADLVRFIKVDPDPIVELCQRWLTLQKHVREAMHSCPTGDFESPHLVELEEARDRLADKIYAMTPQTSEGLAALCDVQALNEGADCLEGTEGWVKEMSDPAKIIMRQIRHGAYLVAGIKQQYLWQT